MRSAPALYVRDQTRYLSRHALPQIIARTSRSVAGIHRRRRVQRHAAGDADRGFGFDPLALTALRTAIAGLCALALLLVLRRPLPPRFLWPQLLIAMLCVAILFPLLMALAVQTVDASHGGVVLGILPIATALVAVVITHERPKPLFWIASVFGAGLVDCVCDASGRRRALDWRFAAVRGRRRFGHRLCLLGKAHRANAGMGSHQLDTGDRAADFATCRGADHAGGSGRYRR